MNMLNFKAINWTPPEGKNPKLDMYISCFRNRVRAEILNKPYHLQHNLTKTEQQAIEQLQSNENIVIKSADKGGATVIMNREDYTTEALRQLTNTDYYQPLTEDPTAKYQRELSKIVSSSPANLRIALEDCTIADPHPGIFYMLPKIHKPGNPGRPIISCIGTITENLSGFLDKTLRPHATKAASYIQDTTEFLNKLSNMGTLQSHAILVTMDVEALYTNIPHDSGLQAIKATLPDDPTKESILKLTEFVLTHNYFSFDEQLYLQVSGTAMGTRMAPQYANIFMARLEENFLHSCCLKPLLYLRFIDDIFMIWTHGLTLIKFHSTFSDFHPSINLTMDHSTESVHFLDTTVKINNNQLITSIYRKPTDKYTYLHADSFHPSHTTRSIVYSQALRYNRICSDPEDRDQHLLTLRQAFTNLKYKPRIIDQQLQYTKLRPREQLLQYKPKSDNDKIPLVTTFNPQLKPLSRIIDDLQPILREDTRLQKIFPDRPLSSFRQPANLKQRLVHSHLSTTNQNPGATPCNKPRCELCKHINTSTTITGPNSETFQIRGQYNCSSTNVIYAITCNQCPSCTYIGETGQTLRKRMNSHKFDIRNNNIHKPVSHHFNLLGHSIQDFAVTVLQSKFRNKLARQIAEQKIISRFNSIDQGLNRDSGFLSNYKH